MKITFYGATQTVTGSKFLLETAGKKLLIDCGLFQGYKFLRLKNWTELPIEESSIDAVVLTHAHLDHSGYIPLLIKQGFRGKIYCTPATFDLCSILLPDAGHLQEEEALFANKRGFSKHHPAKPLYTEKEAKESLRYFERLDTGLTHKILSGIEVEFFQAGHLLGASSLRIQSEGKTIGFSGDLGRYNDPLLPAPSFTKPVDYLVVESTYGNRSHPAEDPKTKLAEIINKTVNRHGVVIIPSFAVGRAQLVLHYINQLKYEKAIPNVPVYLNSPMADRANDAFVKHSSETKLSKKEAEAVCNTAQIVKSVEESKALNSRTNEPMVIISASGMATGGRVLHHLTAFAPEVKNSIVFVGFQAGGTRGDLITKGAREIKIHGQHWPIRAEVHVIDSMSAHADANDIVNWIKKIPQPAPRKAFIVHGEPAASEALRLRLQEMNLEAQLPEYGQSFSL